MTMQRDKAIRAQGRTLARKRRAVGLTQHQIADLTGIAAMRICFIETDRCVATPDELDRIRHALKTRLREVNKEVGAAACA